MKMKMRKITPICRDQIRQISSSFLFIRRIATPRDREHPVVYRNTIRASLHREFDKLINCWLPAYLYGLIEFTSAAP